MVCCTRRAKAASPRRFGGGGRAAPVRHRGVGRRIIADGYRRRDEGPWLPSSPGVAMVREVGPLTRQGGRRAAAAKALWGAANPDPVGAALDAIDSARFAYPHHGPDFLDHAAR